IQITLDGCRREHDSSRKTKSGEGTFDGLLAVLEDLAEEIGDTTSVNVRVNLNDCDITELERDFECIPENVRPKLHLMPRVIFNTERYHHNNKNSYKNIEPYYELFSKMGFSMLSSTNSKVPCEAAGDKNSFYVLPDLSVWKCVNDINVEEACIGRIQKDGDIKYNYCNLAHWFKLANPFNDEKCCECGVEPECGGGCILNRIKNGQRKCRFSGETDLPEFYGTKRNTYS
ncbi:MAG: SPASM domain-containing protein, partial [Lachnospiraceae bacterium]|nr:SPASM domain-containing protein [Lachnospiraceae bacterium]